MFDISLIRTLVHDEEFIREMDKKAKAACLFVSVINNLLGNKNTENYVVLVQERKCHLANLDAT